MFAPNSGASPSFNPCSGGLAVGTISNQNKTDLEVGFNPCSGGLAVGTSIMLGRTGIESKFQSLFWWISCWDSFN